MMSPTVTTGAFKFTITPPTEPVYPTDYLEINGVCQLTPGIFERFLP